jgi:hypothetical protein
MPGNRRDAQPSAGRRDEIATLYRAFIFVAAKELAGGVAGPVRLAFLWLLAAYPIAWALARPSESYGVRLDRRAIVMLGCAAALCAAGAVMHVVDPARGLFGADPADAALVGALVLAAALSTWAAASASICALTGNVTAGVVAAGVLFTMAFFTGSLVADGSILLASIAAAAATRSTGGIGPWLLAVAFAFGGLPGAAVACAGFLLLGIRDRAFGTR